jgi:hypothetical protein
VSLESSFPGPPQRAFGALALSHVHHDTDDLDHRTGAVEHRLDLAMQVPDRTVGTNDAEIERESAHLLDRGFGGLLVRSPIVGMADLDELLEVRGGIAGVQAKMR